MDGDEIYTSRRAGRTTRRALSGGQRSGAVGAKVLVRFAIGTGASQASTNSIPAGALITRSWLEITSAYSAGATITLGQTGSTALLMGTQDSAPTDAIVGSQNVYHALEPKAWGSSTLPLLATVAGSPGAGAGFAAAEYQLPVA